MSFCDVEYGIASFKGIEFEVLPVEYSGGYRVLTHLYPFTNAHYNELLGDKPREFKVKGAFHGEDFRDQLRTAQLRWGAPTALALGQQAGSLLISGDFFEPTQNETHFVSLVDWVYRFDNKKLNYVEFDLTLIEFSNEPYPNLLGAIQGLVAAVDGFGSTLSNNSDAFQEPLADTQEGFSNAADELTNALVINPTDNFTDTIGAIQNIEPRENATENVAIVNGVFETLISNGGGEALFNAASNIGSGTKQGDLFALTGLQFYLESISQDGLTACQLRDFRTRAIALKNRITNIDIQMQINCLISEAGQSVVFIEEETLPGEYNALVASYELYGDISRANEMISLSGGVSGAAINEVVYRP